jgi:outer membrane protein OmpA-like peptidoglycan-associated protein
MYRRRAHHPTILACLFAVALGATSAAFADDHLTGVVTGRTASGGLTVRTDGAVDVTVAISETTKVREMAGIRATKADVPSLIPGLRVKADGTFDNSAMFVATRITFTRADYKTALDIQAGLSPTQLDVRGNRASIDAHSQVLQQNGKQLEAQDRRISANDEKIVATNGAVEAVNGRIANLDNYKVIDTVTIHFRNGQVSLSKEGRMQLQQLAEQAKTVDGYALAVEGHASAVGPDALNQRLSMQRAAAVTAALQQGGVDAGRVFVPAAMGTSQQIADNKTSKGQAENRRTVVRLLQNRGVTGQ